MATLQMFDPAKNLIITRGTHLLIYNPDNRDRDAWKRVTKNLQLYEQDNQGHNTVSFKAYLKDVDPRGNQVIRVPLSTPMTDLQLAFPAHRAHDARAMVWTARRVTVKFKLDEFPAKNDTQEAAFEYLRTGGVGACLLQAGTAAGKSYSAIRAWADRGDVLLGTFAQMNHLANFAQEMKKFTDITDDEILIVNDGRATLQRFLDKPERAAKIKAVLVLHRTVSRSLGESINSGAVTGVPEFVRFVQLMGVGTHVSDECHLELTSVALLSLMANFSATFYMTATPERTNWSENRLLKAVLPFQEAMVIESESRVRVINAPINSNPELSDERKCLNRFRGTFDPSAYFDWIRLKPERMAWWLERLTIAIQMCQDDGAESIGVVLAGKLEFLDEVEAYLQGLFGTERVGNFSSRTKLSVREPHLHRDFVVTTEKSFNGSVNPTRMTHLIMCASVSSAPQLKQIAGRLRGVNGRPCVFVDLHDTGFERLRAQATARAKVLKGISVDKPGKWDLG